MRLLDLLMTLAVATLSFYLVERPGRRIGAQTRNRRGLPRVRWRGRNLATAAIGACVLVAVFVGPLSAIDREASAGAPVASAAVLDRARSRFQSGSHSPGKHAGVAPTRGRARMAARDSSRAPNLGNCRHSLRPLSPHLEAAYPPPCIRGLRGVPRASASSAIPAPARGSAERRLARRDAPEHRLARVRPKKWRFTSSRGTDAAGRDRWREGRCPRRRARASRLRRSGGSAPSGPTFSCFPSTSSWRRFARAPTSHRALPRSSASSIRRLFSATRHCHNRGATVSSESTSPDASPRSTRHSGATGMSSSSSPSAQGLHSWTRLPGSASPARVCPPVIARVPAFKDETHISAEYQLKLIPIMRALLR